MTTLGYLPKAYRNLSEIWSVLKKTMEKKLSRNNFSCVVDVLAELKVKNAKNKKCKTKKAAVLNATLKRFKHQKKESENEVSF